MSALAKGGWHGFRAHLVLPSLTAGLLGLLASPFILPYQASVLYAHLV